LGLVQTWLKSLPNIPPAPTYELTLHTADDAEIQALNAQYRHQNKPTDVLAFAALEVDYPQVVEIQSRLPLYTLVILLFLLLQPSSKLQQQEHTLN